MKKLALAFLLVAVMAPSAMAGPVTVQNTGTAPGQTFTMTGPWYSGGAYAGVENLYINGVLFRGFCIDLYHLSLASGEQYNVDPLAASPSANPPGAMGSANADLIRELWALDYSNALTGNQQAAAFQFAIWEILDGDWSWYGGGADAAYADAHTLIASVNANNGALANGVVGLNPVAPLSAQSYAVQGVPDGGTTLALLGFALIGLGALRRKF